MKINKIKILVLFLLISNLINSQNFLEKINNSTWIGEGSLMNTPTTFKMKWDKQLNDKFYHLDFENKRKNNGNEIVFNAKAFYRINDNFEIEGTWFDSRGVSFPLKGEVSDNQLTVFWGSTDTERGKTIYKLKENEIIVEDYFFNKNKYSKFGFANYVLE